MTTVGVVGAGTMGSGIAELAASAGKNVILLDIEKSIVQAAVVRIEKNLRRLSRRGKIEKEQVDRALSSIYPTEEYGDFRSVDIVIEAASEDMELKKAIFSRVEENTPEGVIIATNTSTLSVTELAMSTSRSERVIGIHFFNPAPIMKLVEVINTAKTSPATLERVMEFAKSLDKYPVVTKDRTGFVVNRILLPMINEAVFVLDEGVATAAEIDNAMKLGANHPIGPLALADLLGLDITLSVLEVLYAEYGDPKFRPAPLLREVVRSGNLGRKTGKGFFEYARS
ncbi:MAG: 3-hydroxyacyl-CoA dehydrogenase NAD-binding domain-containing protein [Candidatus Dadabacteria bacterium]|nr:3-hydroxyacyl-CoA dehydrogenase NAD-binding domain-containing protein [Candidatus Dadabacteria bacterium]MCY4262186.1 3-hydroxyacyl-CoA dehydrogenase NAD-binding domain-containing protein [Candidatus Dadabacteria bacterium]